METGDHSLFFSQAQATGVMYEQRSMQVQPVQYQQVQAMQYQPMQVQQVRHRPASLS